MPQLADFCWNLVDERRVLSRRRLDIAENKLIDLVPDLPRKVELVEEAEGLLKSRPNNTRRSHQDDVEGIPDER